MPITIDGSGTITGAATLATTVASPTFTTPNINSAQFATVSGTAPIYPCRAWVNFNGQGTVAIRASGNVSSITDNGTGDYTANFTTAMPDADYTVAGLAGLAVVAGPMYLQTPAQTTDYTQTTSAFRFGTASAHANGVGSVYRDTERIFVAIFR
jgi:hypothetical protein